MTAVLAPKTSCIAPEDYLQIERAAAVKSEYCDGEMFARSGASKEHNRLAVAVHRSVGSRRKISRIPQYSGASGICFDFAGQTFG